MAHRNKEHRFDLAPQVTIPRCKEPYHQNIKGTLKAGDLVPYFCDMLIDPGTTLQLNQSSVIRMFTPITPVMDNCYLDVYMFAVPWRLTWEHTKEFWGENTESAWYTTTEYTIPKLKSGESASFDIGSVVDYLGLTRTGVENVNISALPVRAYREIFAEWFRDQNLIAPPEKRVNDADTTYDATDPTKGGVPFKIAKYHDYFTSCLPSIVKGQEVTFPLGMEASVYGRNLDNVETNNLTTLYAYNTDGEKIVPGGNDHHALNIDNYGAVARATATNDTNTSQTKFSLYANLAEAVAAPISVVREAFAYSRILERMALAGSRYTEIIKAFWGVNSPDQRLQRPEYLGGFSLPINISEIPQTSETTSTSPLGNVAAKSLTGDSRPLFTKSFTEHTIIIGVMAVRQQHSYQQGTERAYSSFRKLDFYMPPLAHLSQQPVFNKEIFTQGENVIDENGEIVDNQIFGYQEAWAHYRYRPNRICGELRSDANLSLDVWHYADDYENLPVLSEEFINETDEYIKRTLAVQDTETCQFWFDIEISGTITSCRPKYSIPGLLDHY